MGKWQSKQTKNMKYIGMIEFQDNKMEYHDFEIYDTGEYLLFGGHTNNGFLESGYIEKDNNFSLDENLQEMLTDLECYYNDGKQYVNNIICNNRM